MGAIEYRQILNLSIWRANRSVLRAVELLLR
jgi:hypothetical protein